MADRFINAAKDGYLDVLQQATKKDLNWPDEDGMSAVTWAARNGHLDALRLIVGRGGDVDRSDFLGLTPLHHAAQRGLLHVVTYLVNWGANVYSLDNGHHSAMDLASLFEKVEVVRYLDEVYGQQSRKNPKSVSRQKEEAVKQAERNIRRYEKLQDEASRRLQKEQRKMQTFGSREDDDIMAQRPAQRKNKFFKTLTLAIRGNRTPRKTVAPSGKTYSDIAGLSNRGGAARRINQRRDVNGTGTDRHDFRISDVDESGRRTLRSLPAAHGVRSVSSEVMYLTSQRGGDTTAMSDIGTSRPALHEVFGGQPRSTLYKAKSESDLLDSGVDSYPGDEDEDEDNMAGIFNRPGFGKTAFLTGSKFLNTLQSFDGQGDDTGEDQPEINGFSSPVNGDADDKNDVDDGVGKGGGEAVQGPKDLPWDLEDVDDDEDGATATNIETFLWSAQLEGYLHMFLKEKVDLELLVKMSESDLKEIGLPFGPRKRLLDAIRRRETVLSLPKNLTDSYL
ncbi:pre-mRNA splicing regulator USH1G-like [Babylonia areolata]|uniref:pre-mRNA splicing regulator USH1G-like n=1 Tax=Babylonia areolata TaxID=304850 RepID=UPI003FD0F41B